MRLKEFIFNRNGLLTVFNIVFKYLPTYFIATISKNNDNIWLISERKDDARDNGYFMYKYIKENHPEIKVYYAISKKSNDSGRISSEDIINWGSYKHYYYYFLSSRILGTAFNIASPDIYADKIMRHILPPKGKRVFLQHGITINYLEPCLKKKMNADMFVCGAYPEYKYISKTFGYSDNEVKYTGLARFDDLFCEKTDNVIIYMPTWRCWLNENDILKSNYVNCIKELLLNESLNKFLCKNNYKLIFFLHPVFKKYKYIFNDINFKNIEIANNDDYDLHELIKTSKALITDYSSVFFDFSFVNKPVIYYHFDYTEFREKHFSEGYYDYENGLGQVVKTPDSVAEILKNLHDNNWETAKKYKDIGNKFFINRDNKNCERIYNEIIKL